MYSNIEYHKSLYKRQKKNAVSDPRSVKNANPTIIKPVEFNPRTDLDKIMEVYLIEIERQNHGLNAELAKDGF